MPNIIDRAQFWKQIWVKDHLIYIHGEVCWQQGRWYRTAWYGDWGMDKKFGETVGFPPLPLSWFSPQSIQFLLADTRVSDLVSLLIMRQKAGTNN